MSLATGALVLLGFMFALIGLGSKFAGLSLLSPYFSSSFGYFIAANTCFLTAIIVDRFDKK